MREFLRVVFCMETTFDGSAELVISASLSSSCFPQSGIRWSGAFRPHSAIVIHEPCLGGIILLEPFHNEARPQWRDGRDAENGRPISKSGAWWGNPPRN